LKIIGELINASRKPIAEAIRNQDSAYIQKIAREQGEAGANYIDVNAGIFVGREAAYLKWLVTNVQSVVACPCCIDSPDPKVIEAVLEVHKGTAMINSISLEKERYNSLLPLIAGTDLKIVALCMSDAGMPVTADERLKNADKLIEGLTKQGVSLDNIYVDPLVQPVATDTTYASEFLTAIEKIMTGYQGVHTICGLSNVSYGLPVRKFINHVFAIMAIGKGLDALIINPLDPMMTASLVTAETLAGRDDYCMNYLRAYREGKFAFFG
jgi:5-methyltetrahydrofolate corrinoid/iron sulfur protein methyltransferase